MSYVIYGSSSLDIDYLVATSTNLDYNAQPLNLSIGFGGFSIYVTSNPIYNVPSLGLDILFGDISVFTDSNGSQSVDINPLSLSLLVYIPQPSLSVEGTDGDSEGSDGSLGLNIYPSSLNLSTLILDPSIYVSSVTDIDVDIDSLVLDLYFNEASTDSVFIYLRYSNLPLLYINIVEPTSVVGTISIPSANTSELKVPSATLLQKTSYIQSEIDLRKQVQFLSKSEGIHFINLIKELKQMNGIGFQWYGIRKIDYSKKCSCNGSMGISSPENCNRCMKTGYLFTDYLAKGYLWQVTLGVEFNSGPTVLSTQQRQLILEFNQTINKFDYVLELDQDPTTGKIRQPFRILNYFSVQDSLPIKGDGGRYEFWKCALEERNSDDGRPGERSTGNIYQGNRSQLD